MGERCCERCCERCKTPMPSRKGMGRGSYRRFCEFCAPDPAAYLRLYRIARSLEGINARGKLYARRRTTDG